MGCSSSSTVIAPTLSKPKWKDDSNTIDFFSKKPEFESVSLLTDDSLIKITGNSVSKIPIPLQTQESGYLSLTPTKFIIVGGQDKSTFQDTADCFLLTNNNLSPFSPLLFPTRRLRLVHYEGQIYSIGGVRETLGKSEIILDYSNNFEVFGNDKWENLPDLIQGVEYPACFAFAEKIYCSGGCFVKGMEMEVVGIVQVFSLKAKEWSLVKFEVPVCVYGHIALPKDSLGFLLVGGIDCENEKNCMSYIVDVQHFEELAQMPLENSSFFPYMMSCMGNLVYAVNEDKEVMVLNRLERQWKVLAQGKNSN